MSRRPHSHPAHRNVHTYRVIGAGVDMDGWYRRTLERDDGMVVKVSNSRYAQLSRNGQIDRSPKPVATPEAIERTERWLRELDD